MQAMIETIMRSKEKVTLISIAPTPNIARALYLEPRIAKKARFVGMHGKRAQGLQRTRRQGGRGVQCRGVRL